MKKQILGWAVIFAVTLFLTACAAPEARLSMTDSMSGPDETIAENTIPQQTQCSFPYQDIVAMTLLDARELRLDQREIDLEWREDDLAQARTRLDVRDTRLAQREIDLEWREDDVAFARARLNSREAQLARLEQNTGDVTPSMAFEAVPSGAEPGRCYARISIPGEFLTVTDKVLIKPAGEQIEIVPARYETVSEKVLVAPATTRVQVIPAEYRYVSDSVMVEPPKKHLVQVPAQYETVLEQVLVAPATTSWKKGTGPIQRIDEATGEILCLVETPAQYQTVSKSVLKTPATTREVEDPAVFETIQRRELVTPERTELIEVPAQYKTVLVTRMIEPEHEKLIPIPARYQTVTKRVKVTDDRMDWQEVLCETNMTQSKVSDIQRALTHFGYNPGPIDGIIGTKTMAAVNAFQKANDLPVARYLTADTLDALGLGL